jgi:hypothetical protein
MGLTEFSEALGKIGEQSAIYIYADPVVPDFTTGKGFDLNVFGSGISATTEVNPKTCRNIASMLDMVITVPGKTLLAYDIKSTISYIRHYLNKGLKVRGNLIDIRIIEKFMGKDERPPITFVDAVTRSRELMKDKSWLPLFKKLHQPLAVETIPAMETVALLDTQAKFAKWSHYEIEGQTNGRLRSYKAFDRSYLPHTLSHDQKQFFKPRGVKESFLYFDIKNCEVTVMGWLSGDEYLYSLTHGDADVYAAIYKDITGDQCNSDKKREIAKLMFLSVMYGSGYKTLSEKLKINFKIAEELVARIHSRFKTTSNYMKSLQEQAKDGPITDKFGRKREYESPYIARNAVTQAAAAVACLEKLNEIHAALKSTPARLCLSVHDAYCVVCPTDYLKDAYNKIKSIFKVDSNLCDGLRFKVGYSVGDTLGTLTSLSIGGEKTPTFL